MRRVISILFAAMLALGFIAGCGQKEAPKALPVVVEVKIANGAVTPSAAEVKVSKGAEVTIIVNTDVADEIHVHGYDVLVKAEPGKQSDETFTADKAGVFEVEAHDLDKLIVKLVVS